MRSRTEESQMAFRRTKDQARRNTRWNQFRRAANALLLDSSAPEWLYASEERFQQFLMHGCIDAPDRPLNFSVHTMDAAQKAAFREVVIRYLAAGFGDPGLMLFGSDEDDDIRREASLRG